MVSELLKVDDIEGDWVIVGKGGTVVFVGEFEEEPLRPALRFCWLFVFVRPNP